MRRGALNTNPIRSSNRQTNKRTNEQTNKRTNERTADGVYPWRGSGACQSRSRTRRCSAWPTRLAGRSTSRLRTSPAPVALHGAHLAGDPHPRTQPSVNSNQFRARSLANTCRGVRGDGSRHRERERERDDTARSQGRAKARVRAELPPDNGGCFVAVFTNSAPLCFASCRTAAQSSGWRASACRSSPAAYTPGRAPHPSARATTASAPSSRPAHTCITHR